ncbi:hypothetical protein Tco_0733747 [Tanacetum coccineum]
MDEQIGWLNDLLDRFDNVLQDRFDTLFETLAQQLAAIFQQQSDVFEALFGDKNNQAIDINGGDQEDPDVKNKQEVKKADDEPEFLAHKIDYPNDNDARDQASELEMKVLGDGKQDDVKVELQAFDVELEEPMKDQPLSADASPTALSPGHIADSNPEEDEEDPEEDPADYPANEG